MDKKNIAETLQGMPTEKLVYYSNMVRNYVKNRIAMENESKKSEIVIGNLIPMFTPNGKPFVGIVKKSIEKQLRPLPMMRECNTYLSSYI